MLITRRPHMNRVYITGDVDPIRDLLRDFHARQDSTGYWLPFYQESRLRAAVAAEPEVQAARGEETAAWEAAKAAIPSNYRQRHGALLGGDVVIDGERISEPSLDARSLPWTRLASWEERFRDLTGQSTINDRIMNSDTLYVGAVVDGRSIYRIAHYRSFGDDLRETYYLPPDLWEWLMAAEVRIRGITRDAAREWLTTYHGCVGTELYEFAAGDPPAKQLTGAA